jgi:hypothetical protein
MTIVVVSGAMAAKAGNAGNAWTRLSWVGAFERLGFDAWFVEETPPGSDHGEAVAWAAAVARQHGLGDRTIFAAPGAAKVRELVAESELVLNISGHLSIDALAGAGSAAHFVFLDDDPGFTQIWAAEGRRGSRIGGHDLHVTFGANIGTPTCALPTNDVHWHAVRPPVLLDEWPARTVTAPDRLTTVTSWRAPYGAVSSNGRTYTLKHHEFRKLFPLPALAPASYDIAMPIDPAESSDLNALAAHGWIVSDAAVVTSSTDRYREWIAGSGAEISAAHGVYAETSSGWISDRTAAYLASGRPAVVQSTGLEANVATGEGLLTFVDVEGAAQAIRSVLADYERHSKAARVIAEELFDAVAIASRVCELAGVSP